MPEEKSYVLLLSIYVHYIFCIHVYKFIIFLFPIKDLIEKTNEVDTPYILILKYLGFFFRKPINLYNLLFVSAVRFRLFFIHYILSYKIILFKHLFAKVSVLKKFF